MRKIFLSNLILVSILFLGILQTTEPMFVAEGQTTYFDDSFTNFDGWTYMSDSNPGGTIASDGNMAYASNYGSEQSLRYSVRATKALSQSILPTEDFELKTFFQCLTDPTGALCGCGIILLDDANEQIAAISWEDYQALPGYGETYYSAETNNIYKSDPDSGGWGNHYPTINNTLSIKRIGDQWSAYLDGIQLGSNFTHTPTRTATQMNINFAKYDGYPARESKIDYIIATSPSSESSTTPTTTSTTTTSTATTPTATTPTATTSTTTTTSTTYITLTSSISTPGFELLTLFLTFLGGFCAIVVRRWKANKEN
ncbi:MAG: hypothetical protein ACFFBD_03870 [Candidatus Hodarchaeota archaeon]